MKNFSLWLFDTLCGIFFCTGLALILWLVFYLAFRAPEFNATNVSFLAEVISLFWALGFIFHFISPVITKGILHSILCFMLSMILFLVNFGYVPASRNLVICMFVFFVCYALALWGIVSLSNKINSPLRHFPDWLIKLRPQSSQKINESE